LIVEVNELIHQTDMGEGGSKIIAFGETVRSTMYKAIANDRTRIGGWLQVVAGK
jgi:hypothetical protein